VFRDVKGKDVLCLASAGGQQSVAFGLLGARVTVFDFCEKQLEMDQQAAAHHGYDITTVVGDMRDLSALATNSFDLVYHAISICFVPDTREVYTGVARVLRPGGIYRVGHINPATYGMEEDAWDGEGYRIMEPNYHGLVERADAKEYRHSLSDIIMGLVEKGFVLESVDNDPRHFVPAPDAVPGSAEHLMWWTQSYFALTTRLGGACK
jgi:ubiquinone/menaquinone biosynthesis C-methylase UbiE